MDFPDLDFPLITPRLRKDGNKTLIFDKLRKKFVVLTPEEWVRQHVINFLITQKFPAPLIAIESSIFYNKMNRRTDIVVFNRSGQPHLLVECKAPHISLSEAVFKQACVYNSVVKAKYVFITNGLSHFCLMQSPESEYTALNHFPVFEENEIS